MPTIREFSLGLAPLAESLNDVAILNGRPLGWKSIIEKIGFSVGNATTALYNYNQLFRFKSKFEPRWEPRYLIIPSISSLPKALYSITKAHLQ
jgi:phosphatidylglycerol lysyltransferase